MPNLADIPAGDAAHSRIFNTGRRDQGFLDQRHLDLFYAGLDHRAGCAECQQEGPGMWLEGSASWQPTLNSCDEAKRLSREEREHGEDVRARRAVVPRELLCALHRRLSAASKPSAMDEAAFEAASCLEAIELWQAEQREGAQEFIERQFARMSVLLGASS